VPHVLYVVHGLPPAEHTGTPLVALGYAQALSARGWTVTVVSGTDPTVTSWAAPETVQEADEGFLRVRVPISPLHGVGWAVHAASVRGVETPAAAGFARILRRRRPDVVHVVDNVNLPLELPEVAKAAGIPVVRTVSCAEDLCGLIAPVSPCSAPSGYCLPPLTAEHCADCVAAAHPGLLTADPRERRQPGDERGDAGSVTQQEDAWRRRRLLEALRRKRARAVHQYTKVFDRIVFSNPAWRRYFEATLPLDPTRARTVAMGMDLGPWAGARSAGRSPDASEPVVLGIAGTLDVVKGAGALLGAFTAPELLARDDYRLRCIGGGDPALLAALAAGNPRVELHDRYRAEELPDLLADLHVGLAPSYFETFHRVTREYLLAGLPVVASRALGVLDVVRHGVNGLLFDHGEPGAFVRAVVAILDDRELLARLRAGAAETGIRSVDD
jgi:glycosyltransferase involved in cell wall biosynthesis